MNAKERLEALEAVVGALAHPARRQILLTVHLVGGTTTAGRIVARFSFAWPTITRHLRVLENAGLLTHRRVGRSRVYSLNRERLKVLRDWLGWFDHVPNLVAPEVPTTATTSGPTEGVAGVTRRERRPRRRSRS